MKAEFGFYLCVNDSRMRPATSIEFARLRRRHTATNPFVHMLTLVDDWGDNQMVRPSSGNLSRHFGRWTGTSPPRWGGETLVHNGELCELSSRQSKM